jgi:transcription initiation factor IIF auxiliary subunit
MLISHPLWGLLELRLPIYLAAETKEQVVAHLANFAYDPFNYDILRKVHIPSSHTSLLQKPDM